MHDSVQEAEAGEKLQLTSGFRPTGVHECPQPPLTAPDLPGTIRAI
jgi:hypothetical protein